VAPMTLARASRPSSRAALPSSTRWSRVAFGVENPGQIVVCPPGDR
jgi:hypothetical protein